MFFDTIAQSLKFEKLGKGRKIAIVAKPTSDGMIPLVRSASKYTNPVQLFTPEIESLANDIALTISILENIPPPNFNNMMAEIYTTKYKTMGYHSDHSLDLESGSWICIFSCYKEPDSKSLRILRIKNKSVQEEQDIVLEHNSIVFFSEQTNSLYLHKIIIPSPPSPPSFKFDNLWLGQTFRSSKTFLNFDHPSLPPSIHHSDHRLRLATASEEMMFLRMKKQQNESLQYEYPIVDYTLSPSDILTPQTP